MATTKLSLPGPATLRDVARLAGVHPGTVSRALNPQTRSLVNERTARRVLDAAQELGYRPNPIARGLRTNRSHTIGVLVPDLMNPLFAAVVRGIEDGLRDGGYTPLIANTDNDAERERVAYEAMRARQVDGFIAATARRDHWLLEERVDSGPKVVLVNRRVDSDAIPAVTGDDHAGVRHEHADRVRAVGPQAPCDRVGSIPKLLGGIEHPSCRPLVDQAPGLRIERPRHCPRVDSGQPRHVSQGRRSSEAQLRRRHRSEIMHTFAIALATATPPPTATANRYWSARARPVIAARVAEASVGREA